MSRVTYEQRRSEQGFYSILFKTRTEQNVDKHHISNNYKAFFPPKIFHGFGVYMDIKQIVDGLKKSPLSEAVKKQIIYRIDTDSEKITTHIKRFPTRGLIGKSMNYQGDVATYIINYIADILVENSIPPENGRDTARHIYQALGGKNKINFEL